jgi:hypothetical protein
MAAAGINSVRTYVPPPAWLLDAALEHDVRVMVGFAWEQHVAFLDDPERPAQIAARLGEEVRACEGHPAILCYSIGNEIPAPIVRWHGKRPVEQFLERLHWEAKTADPEGLVTYVNYPSTEYLELPFLDLTAFNVFLEEKGSYEAYLARLQNLSGDRPLLITEVGLDSRRNGAEEQARTLGWQVRQAFGGGGGGDFVLFFAGEAAAPPAPSSSPGPTSGTAAATTSSTGTSAWSIASASRSRPSTPSAAPLPRCRSPSRAPGRRSRSSSAPTTARAPSTSAWSGSAPSPIPSTR